MKLDQSKAEPDWLIGQKDGAEGCFPMAYVQLADNDIYPDIPTKSTAKMSTTKEPWSMTDSFSSVDAVYDTPPRSVNVCFGHLVFLLFLHVSIYLSEYFIVPFRLSLKGLCVIVLNFSFVN